eukprot:scaffold172205_cov33-Tisochrysis_lutea.AAC.3
MGPGYVLVECIGNFLPKNPPKISSIRLRWSFFIPKKNTVCCLTALHVTSHPPLTPNRTTATAPSCPPHNYYAGGLTKWDSTALSIARQELSICGHYCSHTTTELARRTHPMKGARNPEEPP